MPGRPDVPCARCGTLLWSGKGCLPAGERTCRSCRKNEPRPYGKRAQPTRRFRCASRPCTQCATVYEPTSNRQKRCVGCASQTTIHCPCGRTKQVPPRQTYCSKKCAQRYRPRPHGTFDEADRKARRRALERAAPGLNQRERGALLVRWRRHGRACWACAAPGSTVDHIVPLSRGGTNYEGNLAPACKSHNSSRGSALVVEWRHRKVRGTRLARLLVAAAA